MTLTIPVQWREAIALSLLFNLFLFTLTAALTERKKSEQVEYIPVEMIQLSGEEKQIQIPPSAPRPPENEPQPQVKPEPPVEKEMGMDKTGVEAAPPAPQKPQVVYQPFHKVTRMPYFKTQVKPEYPKSERAAGVEARVTVEVYINEFGGVDDVKIVKSAGPLFDRAVVNAVKVSTFDPAYMEGRPVAVRVQIPYVFKLQ